MAVCCKFYTKFGDYNHAASFNQALHYYTARTLLYMHSAFHSRTRPRPAHPSDASRVHPKFSSLHVLTRAQRMRLHFCPKHWLLCHLGLY